MRDGEGPGGFTRPVFLPHGRGPARPVRLILVVLAGLAMRGCGGAEEAGPIEPDTGELRIAIVSGDGQQASAGSSLPDFLVVRVSRGETQPVEGVPVEWTVLEGDAELSRKGPDTDAQGLAAAVLFVSGQPGERIIRASLESGAEVLFTAHVVIHEPPPVPPGRRPRSGI